MARKKRGVTLFELLRKDAADPRKGQPVALPDGLQQAPTAAGKSQPAVETPLASSGSTGPKVEADEDGYVVHVTRQQAILFGAVAAVVLVVFLLIGSRMFGGDPAATAGQEQPAAGQAAGQTADDDRDVPLETIRERAATEPRPQPDDPVRLPRQAQTPARVAEASSPQPPSASVALPRGDTRQRGLNYVVIQIVPNSAKPSPAEHAAKIREFLAGKGIRTLLVRSETGSLMVVSEQGFETRQQCEPLMEKVRQAGKEYASAKYMGRYNFATPYADKY